VCGKRLREAAQGLRETARFPRSAEGAGGLRARIGEVEEMRGREALAVPWDSLECSARLGRCPATQLGPRKRSRACRRRAYRRAARILAMRGFPARCVSGAPLSCRGGDVCGERFAAEGAAGSNSRPGRGPKCCRASVVRTPTKNAPARTEREPFGRARSAPRSRIGHAFEAAMRGTTTPISAIRTARRAGAPCPAAASALAVAIRGRVCELDLPGRRIAR